ncbi:hypothetical protein ACQJBY_062580 [Aegilops geniculata]
MWMVILLLAGRLAAAIADQEPPITIHPDCPSKCGNMSIPYPFGMKPGCFLPGFEVTCNDTFFPHRAFIAYGAFQQSTTGFYTPPDQGNETFVLNDGVVNTPTELMDISLSSAYVRVYAMVSSDCKINSTHHSFVRRRTYAPTPSFLISASHNILIGVGLNVEAELSTSMGGTFGADISRCTSVPTSVFAKDGPCRGQGCCEAALPRDVSFIAPVADKKRTEWWRAGTNCSTAMLVQKGWYNYSSADVYGGEAYFSNKFPKGVPQVFDFAIGNGSCPAQGQPLTQGYACLSGNSSCLDATNRTGYVCKCWEHYDGNPYVPGGCQDIDECVQRERHPQLQALYPCSSGGICKNRLGGYDCPCKPGMKGDGKTGTCTEKFPLPAKVAVGVVGGISIAVVLVLFVLFMSERKKMRESFIRNGGPLLEKINNIKIFREVELKRITKNYSHILGSGAFGVVYKGFLDDKHIAVKKSKSTTKAQKDQFANEVIVQSRVIHKNIVRLIGCCLEVDVPILVYEFISNGSLEDILYDKNRIPLTIDQRLVIAAESAEGLAYMHSKTSANIQHGDVKPANILLGDTYIPKISDFGISRLIARGDAQHSEEVIGDNNYMDPVYRETGLLTNKSDVYSFGLVLFELITGKKANCGDNCSFVLNHLDTYTGDNRANVMYDMKIKEEKDFKLLKILAEIARECLHHNVEQRPEMTDIAESLQNIRKARNK